MVEGSLEELERVRAGLHHYTLHEGRMGFACFPPVCQRLVSVLQNDLRNV